MLDWKNREAKAERASASMAEGPLPVAILVVSGAVPWAR